MLLKVNPETKESLKPTWTSRFVRLLLKICFFPVTIDGDEVLFSWLSWKTLFHFVISIGVYSSFSIWGLSSIDFLGSVEKSFFKVGVMH